MGENRMTWSYSLDGRFLGLIVALAGLLFLASWFAVAASARGKALIALRAAALGVLVVILLNPMRVEQVKHVGPTPTAVFLIDESRSMSLEAPADRARAAQAIMNGGEAFVPDNRRPTIQKFSFGRGLKALKDKNHVLSPVEDETQLVRALEELPSRFDGSFPFGVFVFSDGRSTDPESLEPVARAYRALGVPVHVAPVGNPRISGDVAVRDLDAPRDARPGTRVPVRVTVRSRGYAGERAIVQIRKANEPGGEPLAALPVTLADGEQAHELVIDTDRAKGGLVAEVPLLPNEAIAANNVVPFQITPRDSKLHVIYMEGSATSEIRYLQDALHEDPKIKCTSLTVDNQYSAVPTLRRIDDPSRGFPTTRAELLSYDAVICSDIARTAFTPEQLAWTVELVNKRGGGFAMVGGHTSFGSGGWDQTVWDGLIPIDMSGRGPARSQYYDGSFRVLVPPAVADHPIWRIVDDPIRNRQVLDRMPMFYGTNLTDRLKPAATALGLSDQPLAGSGVVTVFSCQTFGRGRTMAMATDTTEAWGTDFEKNWGEGDNRYYRKFWRNAVRWLTENVDGGDRRLRAETDKIIYRPGESIQITAKAFDEALAETDRYRLAVGLRGTAEVDSRTADEVAVNLVPELSDRAYRGTLPVPPASRIIVDPGSTTHKLVLDVVAFDGDNEVARTNLDLQVIDDPAEFRDPRPDIDLLTKLAKATGGSVVHNAAELASLLGKHEDASVQLVVTRRPVWDTPMLWSILVGLLATEWIVRRLKGLA
jgi:uncharacterized membrane protein